MLTREVMLPADAVVLSADDAPGFTDRVYFQVRCVCRGCRHRVDEGAAATNPKHLCDELIRRHKRTGAEPRLVAAHSVAVALLGKGPPLAPIGMPIRR